MLAWQKVVAVVAAGAMCIFSFMAVDSAPAGALNVRLAIDVPGRGQFVATYRCADVASKSQGIAAAPEPGFRTIAFHQGDRSLILSTADVPNIFCREGRYVGGQEISGPFNLIELNEGAEDDFVVLARLGSFEDAANDRPVVLQISAQPTGQRLGDNRAGHVVAAYYDKDFLARYASLPVVELAIRPSGDSLDSQTFSEAMIALRSRLRLGNSTRVVSPGTLCGLPTQVINNIFSGLDEMDQRRGMITPFISCAKASSDLTLPRNVAVVDTYLGRIRSMKLLSPSNWLYDRGGVLGDGILLSCSLPIERCRARKAPDGRSNSLAFSIKSSDIRYETTRLSKNQNVYYFSDPEFRDSIIVINNKFYEFDLGGVL